MSLDVLLIEPPLGSVALMLKKIMNMPPLGICYLAAVLEKAGYTVAIVDMWAEKLSEADIVQIIREKKPRVVGISTMVTTYKNGLRIAEAVKRIDPKIKVLVGGPQATFLIEETLACQSVDIVVRFEGEETILELMQHFDNSSIGLDQIRGIAYREKACIHHTPDRPYIKDLDSLPTPAYHLLKMMDSYDMHVVITTRGCPSQCVFCAANAIYGKPSHRVRSPKLVADEIEGLIRNYGASRLYIADDAFTLRPARAIEICDLIIQRQLNVSWTCETRVDTMTKELAEKLYDAGCVMVQYGVETGNPEIMKLIRKGISLEQVEEVVAYTSAVGLNVSCTFVVGFPWDTDETVRQTIEFGRKLARLNKMPIESQKTNRGVVTPRFAPLTPLPGTYIYEHADELGIQYQTDDWNRFTFFEPVISTSNLTASQIRKYHMNVHADLNR